MNDSDSSEEEQRVVKKTTDKRQDQLQSVFDKIKNHAKNNDFKSLQNDLDDM